MSCKATISLEPRPWYTCGDEISGTVRIEQKKDIDINEIIVQLIGEVYCVIFDGNSTIDRTARTLEQTQRLFPDQQLGELMSQYTLREGVYEYPFKFTVPGHLAGEFLLPTFKTPSAHIRYFVKATVKRSSNWKINTRAECPIMCQPCTDAGLLDDPVRIETHGHISMTRRREVFKNWGSSTTPVLSASIGVRQSGLCASSHSPELQLILIRNDYLTGSMKLVSVSVALRRTDWYCPTAYSSASLTSKKVLLSTTPNLVIPFKEEREDVSEVLKDVRVPSTTVASLNTGFIDVQYRLDVTLVLEYGKARRSLTLKPQVHILSDIVHDHAAPPSSDQEALPAYDSHRGATSQPPQEKSLSRDLSK